MILKQQPLYRDNLNKAFLSLTNTNPQTIQSNLTIGGGALTLKNTVLTDNASTSYFRIDPQGNNVIIYDGVNNQMLSTYSSSGSEYTYITTINQANNQSYGIIDVSASASIDHLGINTSSNKTVLFGSGRVGIGLSAPAYMLDVNGDIRANAWLRTMGNAGWYSETYGGGLYMTDSTWLRTYNGKGVYIQKNTAAINNGSYDGGNLELMTSDASNPILGFHRSGYTAVALYHNGYTGGQGADYLRVRGADGWDSALAFARRLTSSQLNNPTNLASGIYENSGDGILNNDGTPFQSGWYHVIHSKHDSDGFAGQIAIPLSPGSEEVYWRRANGTAWYGWRRIFSTDGVTNIRNGRLILPVGTNLYATTT